LGFAPLGSDPGVFLRKSDGWHPQRLTHNVDDSTGICFKRGGGVDLEDRHPEVLKIKEKDTSKPFKVLGILDHSEGHSQRDN